MKRILYHVALIIVLFCAMAFRAPQTDSPPYTKAQVESFIREVFADKANELVFTEGSPRLALIENFLNRVEVVRKPELAKKKFTLLSSVQLQNKYNPNLTRDLVYVSSTFNPLKYNLPMSSKEREIFRIDHTDYLIVIQPLK